MQTEDFLQFSMSTSIHDKHTYSLIYLQNYGSHDDCVHSFIFCFAANMTELYSSLNVAMNLLQKNTCIKFKTKKFTNESTAGHVVIFTLSNGRYTTNMKYMYLIKII